MNRCESILLFCKNKTKNENWKLEQKITEINQYLNKLDSICRIFWHENRKVMC